MEIRSKQDIWNDHIHAWRVSGLSRVAYCEQHGLEVSKLAYWAGKQRQASASLTLVPLSLGQQASGPVLHGGTGWRLELPAQASPAWIADLLRRLP